MNSMIDKIAEAIYLAYANHPDARWDCVDPRMQENVWRQHARVAIFTLREPTHAITRAMAESRARDDEGEFPILLDLLEFSGENKAHTALAQAWRNGIDAVLREG